MNEVIKNIEERRSVRFFSDTPVKEEDIETILECAKITPSGLNKQTWHFTVCRDRALMDEISEANKQKMLASGNPMEIEKASEPDYDSFRTAKMAIIISEEDGIPYANANCANAATIMTLVATSLGLGSCYLAGFSNILKAPEGAEFCARLNIPEGFTPVFAVSLGYTAQQPKPRKPLREDTVNYVG